jgi:hypothetical protein
LDRSFPACGDPAPPSPSRLSPHTLLPHLLGSDGYASDFPLDCDKRVSAPFLIPPSYLLRRQFPCTSTFVRWPKAMWKPVLVSVFRRSKLLLIGTTSSRIFRRLSLAFNWPHRFFPLLRFTKSLPKMRTATSSARIICGNMIRFAPSVPYRLPRIHKRRAQADN